MMFTTPWIPGDRAIGFGAALCGLAIVLLNAGALFVQAPHFETWWLALALATPALQIVALLGWRLLPARALRVIWILQPLLLLLALILVYAAWSDRQSEPSAPVIWLLDSTVIAAAVLVVRLQVAAALTFLLAAAPLLSAMLFLGTLPTPLLTLGFVHASNVIFVMLVFAVRQQLRRLNQARTVAEKLESEGRRAQEESEGFPEFARMVHDEVLASFAAALRFEGAPPAAVRASAEAAPRALDRGGAVAGESEESIALAADDAGQLILDLVEASCPDVPMLLSTEPGTVPAAAAEAVGLATAEAARNALRHAGGGSGSVMVSDGSIRVTISDAGGGFDPRGVPGDRFGVRESILGRLDGLEGGRVLIDSDETGTSVVMRWTRPGE